MAIAPERKKLSNNEEYWSIFLENSKVGEGSIPQYRSSTFRTLNAINKPIEQITPNDIDLAIETATTKINKLYVKSFFRLVYQITDLKESITNEMIYYLVPEEHHALIRLLK